MKAGGNPRILETGSLFLLHHSTRYAFSFQLSRALSLKKLLQCLSHKHISMLQMKEKLKVPHWTVHLLFSLKKGKLRIFTVLIQRLYVNHFIVFIICFYLSNSHKAFCQIKNTLRCKTLKPSSYFTPHWKILLVYLSPKSKQGFISKRVFHRQG